MGLATTTLASNSVLLGRKSGSTEGIGLPSRAEPLSVDFSYLDPVIDREQPIQLTAAKVSKAKAIAPKVMDDRDAHTMSGVSVQSKENAHVKTQALAEISKESKATVVDKLIPKVNKSIDFAHDYDDDIYVAEHEKPLLISAYKRLQRVQQTIGFGHFNLVGFDQALSYARRYSDIGEFTAQELDFIEKVFFTDAGEYGFYGEKVNAKLTDQFKKSDTVKIPMSGHYILKQDSLAYYEKLKRDVGGSIILTSGIRSNVKQLYLFLAKTVRVKGNLSRASRSLAPPGYSYHGIGDFDVGRVGWGAKNFTDDFASTNEFKRMQDLGYIAIRYDHGNDLGVRFEPWHIKVV